MSFIKVTDLEYSYHSAGRRTRVLDKVSFSIDRGELVAIQGRSGAGKSTLFYLLGGLLVPDSGQVHFDGTELSKLTSEELALFRNRKVGFIFQQFHLLPRTSVLGNILLPAKYPCETSPGSEAHKKRATALAHQLGLGERLHHLPNQLSGGEQQRVAIARALLLEPELILADEPTGNLDTVNAQQIMDILKGIRDSGRTVCIITHEQQVADRCGRILRIEDGKLQTPSRNEMAVTTNRETGSPQTLVPQIRASRWRLLRAVAPLALQNLQRNRTRAFLTMVGVTIGISALFAMVTFGKFARDQILAGYEELGSNSLMMHGWTNQKREASDAVEVIFEHFSYEKDLLPLKRIFPAIQLLSPVMQGWGNTVHFGGRSVSDEVTSWGIGSEFNGISRRGIQEGRTITALDEERRSPVCLIGSQIRERLFPSIPPIGQILFVSRRDGSAFPCQVIGVMAPQTSAMEWRKPNLEIAMPYTYFQGVHGEWEGRIQSFVAAVRSGEDVEHMGEGLKNYFRLKYATSGEFMIDSNLQLVAQVKKSLRLFSLLLGAIAAITLIVGGMGINNMMLVSLAERLKEIGLIKAIGGTGRSIRAQFLLESSFLCGIAGVIGIAIGFTVYEVIIFLASHVVSKLSFAWFIDPAALVLSTLSILVVGVASGLVPALKAERLSVIEALRSE